MVAALRKTFATGRTRSQDWRRTQLRALEKLMAENETAIADALNADLGRKPFEAWLWCSSHPPGAMLYPPYTDKAWKLARRLF